MEKQRNWTERYLDYESSYAELLTWDPFRDWQRLEMVETRVEDEFFSGLAIGYAKGSEDPNAVSFFRRSCLVAERALADDYFEKPPHHERFPLNRAMLTRSYAYARALLGGAIDCPALNQSASDFVAWCDGYGTRQWDSQAQAYYLAAVRLLILGGDLDRVRALLKSRKSFKWHPSEHKLWTLIGEGNGVVSSNRNFAPLMNTFFGELKLPRNFDVFVESDVLRLEVAAIRDKYMVSEDNEVDWSRTVASVGP